MTRFLCIALAVPAGLGSLSCQHEGCLGGTDAACMVPPPCAQLSFPSCLGGFARVGTPDTRPGGPHALGAVGDIVLENDQIQAVIDSLDQRNYLAPTGGTLIDLAVRGADNDHLNQVLQATGILPGDAFHYEGAPTFLSDSTFAAVQFRGHLDGHPNQIVATRYEVRPCEPGVRVRTEIVNLDPDPALWSTSDGFFWGDRGVIPFVPAKGVGFNYPPFGLTTLTSAYMDFPFLGASSHTSETAAASYALVGCNLETFEGWNSTQVSSAGLPRRLVMPRDFQVYERFLAVARGTDVAPAVDVALQVRQLLFGQKTAKLSGRIVTGSPGTPVGGSEVQASLIVEEGVSGSAESDRTPWTQVVPATDGTFSATVPDGKHYVIAVYAFGNKVGETPVQVNGDTAVGDLNVPLVGSVTLSATKFPGGATTALVLAWPADDATATSSAGTLYGVYESCAPYLGPAHGAAPACNRLLVDGTTTALFPPGHYYLYATVGPFSTIDRQEVTVTPGSNQSVTFRFRDLPIAPTGTLSGDFHVHGGASFDSGFDDYDRVLAFVASQLDVIAATDHKVASDYGQAIAAIQAAVPSPPSASALSRVVVMSGTETTGLVLWMKTPGSAIPLVIGHWNFWPIAYDPCGYRKGTVDDDYVEPGALFDRIEPTFTSQGVRQLNHPWADAEFGRDLAFPRALGINLNHAMPKTDDGTLYGMLIHTPAGASRSNISYDSQEVMNGTRNGTYLPYRAVWFYLLNQGIVKAGTADSDSHTLTDDVLGTPRNVVYTATTTRRFDPNVFNADVRQGHIIGTNGPILEATMQAADGSTRQPSVNTFAPPPSGAALTLKVSAAPWVPVDEIRVIVNGKVAKTITPTLTQPSDPFGSAPADFVRYQGTVLLDPLLPSDNRDSWVIVEAGAPMIPTRSLCGNGIPDTTDNNGDGVIDQKDVAPGQKCGPLNNPPQPALTDWHFHFYAVTPGGYPVAFTNPFVLDRDGDGQYSGPGLPPPGGN